MEKIFTIIFIAISAVFATVFIKKYAPDYCVAISIGASVVIIFLVITEFGEVIGFVKNFLADNSANGQWVNSIIKVTMVSFIGQWGAGIGRDAGENSIAEKIETAVKIMILIICLPYINMLFAVAEEIN